MKNLARRLAKYLGPDRRKAGRRVWTQPHTPERRVLTTRRLRA